MLLYLDHTQNVQHVSPIWRQLTILAKLNNLSFGILEILELIFGSFISRVRFSFPANVLDILFVTKVRPQG